MENLGILAVAVHLRSSENRSRLRFELQVRQAPLLCLSSQVNLLAHSPPCVDRGPSSLNERQDAFF